MTTRIIVVGDELIAGVGDPRALGWVGRVAARTIGEIEDLEVVTLALPGESTAGLSERWEAEVSRRIDARQGINHRLVIGLGRHDLTEVRSIARSRLNLANILDRAEDKRLKPLVVGPPPGRDSDLPQVQELSTAFGDVATRRRVPYVETCSPLAGHDQWRADLASSADGATPGQAGYGLIAWLVLHTGWKSWLGLSEDD